MGDKWNYVKPGCCNNWLVLPTVYSDALSYKEQLDKFCYQLNKLIANNNILPDFINELIKEYINSGAIGEVVKDILAGYVLNVKYPPEGITPAVGDGSADDTEAIQGCIDYAYNNGGMSIYFPSGSYLTQPLTLRNKATLFGQDRYTTRLVMKGGATKAMFTGDIDELTLTGLGFDGNMDIQVNDVSLFTISVNSAIIANCLLTGGYELLNISVNDNLQLSDVIFNSAVENALVLKGSGIVQGNNLVFKSVSALVGKNFVVMDVSNSILEQLKCYGASPNAVLINGDNNVVNMWNEQSLKAYTDNGTNNTVEVYTHSEQEKLTGSKTTNVGGNLTETVAGVFTENNSNRNTTISGKWIVNFPSRTLDMETIPRVNVKDYGAIGDGVTDDTAAIMAMITALGYAFFTPGTYLTNLEFTTPVTLIGCNPKTCVLKAKDTTKNVVTFSSYCNAKGLTFTGGLNGIECKNAIGNIVSACVAENNTQYGFFINGKATAWTDNNALTGLSYCYARLNGKGGIVIHDYADWKMDNCECVSNTDTFNQNSNVEIVNGAGKMVNCHFWNYNDGSGFKRPQLSLSLSNCGETEITNCHIEGGYEANISIVEASAPTFVNCLIYNSFGSYSIWIDSNHVKFIGCILRTQAPDEVSYKPEWSAIFNNGGTDCLYGVLSKCEITGELFTNSHFNKWDIDSYLDFDPTKLLSNISQHTSLRGFQGDSRIIKMNNYGISGGASIDVRSTTYGYITQDTALIGTPYPGDIIYLYNDTGDSHTITLPPNLPAKGSDTYALGSHESIMIVFSTDSSLII